MRKLEVTLLARVYLVLYLEDYLNDFTHDKDEEDLINNLLEKFENSTTFVMTFSEAELKLLFNSIEHALDTRSFVPQFVIE